LVDRTRRLKSNAPQHDEEEAKCAAGRIYQTTKCAVGQIFGMNLDG